MKPVAIAALAFAAAFAGVFGAQYLPALPKAGVAPAYSVPPKVAVPTVVAQVGIGPAPDGEPTVVAQRIISENFDPPDCPLVIRAFRLGDGSIKSFCNNGESYRILSVNAKNYAMRCSVVNKLGPAGC
jgi:hypothetical protein